MPKFDDLLQQGLDAGADPDWIESLKDASPLRAEKRELEGKLQEAVTNAERYRTATLAAQFSTLGVKVKPDALNIPADLDPLDTEKVSEWAVSMGLAEPPPPPLTLEQQRGHEQLVDASAGAEPPPRHDARAEVLEAKTREEWIAKGQASGLVH